MNQAISQLAEAFSLRTDHGVAYGYAGGCFISIAANDEAVTFTIHVGKLAPDDLGEYVRRATAVQEQCQSGVLAHQLQLDPFSPVYGPPIKPTNGFTCVAVRFPAQSDRLQQDVACFIREILPHAAPMTHPSHCHLCGRPTNGAGCPVMVSPGVVVPAHIPCLNHMRKLAYRPKPRPSSLSRGIRSAAAGTLIGIFVSLLLRHMVPVGAAGLFIALSTYAWCRRSLHGTLKTCIVLIFTLIGIILFSCINHLALVFQEYLALGLIARKLMSFTAYFKATLPQRLDGSLMTTLLSDALKQATCAVISLCPVWLLSLRKQPAVHIPFPLSGKA